MTEIRLLRAFRDFDEPLPPDAAFADLLYASLADELGLGVAGARRPNRRIRALQDLLDALRSSDAPRWRLAVQLALVVALLAALLVALAFVGDLLPRRLTADELVSRSQAAYRTAPALTMEARGTLLDAFVLSTDGRGTWRIAILSEGATYYLYDGVRSATYNAQQRTWGAGLATDRGGPPFPFNGEFTWATGEFTDSGDRTTMPCDAATDLGEAPVIGRVADHVVCGDIDMEYWIDRETGLVLRMEAGPTTPHWQHDGPVPPVVEVTSLRLGMDDPEAFSWAGPPDAFDESNPPPSTVLSPGMVAPRWTGTALDGREIDTGQLEKPTVFVFCSTGSCSRAVPGLESAASLHPETAAVVVVLEYAGTAAGYLTEHPISLPIVADSPPEYPLLTKWALGFPTAVLLDRDGTVASVIEGAYAPEDWDAILTAFERSEPVPAVAPLPGPTPWPMPSNFDFGELTTLNRGETLPSWSGPLLAGGRLDSTALLGRPAVIWFWWGWDCDGCGTDDLLAYGSIARALAGQANLVIVAHGERAPGQVAEILRGAGVDVPTVFDWDRAIESAFRQGVAGIAYVAGEDGRLLDVTEGPPAIDDLVRLVPGLQPGR